MITIIANITIASDKVTEAIDAFLDLVEASKDEDGCHIYELYQDQKEPNKMTFFETWESREHWQAHMNGEAFLEFQDYASHFIVNSDIREVSMIA